MPVSYFDKKPELQDPVNLVYWPNLHAVWDASMVQEMMRGKTVEEFAAELDQAFRSQSGLWEKETIDLNAWAWKSHQLAEQWSYGALRPAVPIEQPQTVKSCADPNGVTEKMLKLDEKLGREYENAVTPIIREQLAKAGIRLAMILNQIWQ